jgi:SAM-dependent methyltransferase
MCAERAQEEAMAVAREPDVPPPAAMMGLITGYWVSQAVGAVALLGVADHLADGPRRSDELAQAVGADPHALYRVLRLLASLGVFVESSSGSFGLTPLGETLRSDAPGSVRNFAITETAPGHWLPWGRLAESVRTGRPMAREALGMELFDWYAQNPEEADVFTAAMGNLSALAADELVRVYDVSSVRTVADIGGAHGVLLAAVLRANPAARGILFDLPHVIATARDAVAAAGIADRCELVSGDFFDSVPDGADLHLLKQIVHDWDDARATQLLRNCHRALAPAGKLVLVEMVIPSDNRPSPAQAMDLNMLVMQGGRERTEAEYRHLLEAADFRLERVIPTHSPFSVIEATRV